MLPRHRELLCDDDPRTCFYKLANAAALTTGADQPVQAVRKEWGVRLRVDRPDKERRLGEAVLEIRARPSEAGTVVELIPRRHPSTRATTAIVLLTGVSVVVGLRVAYGFGVFGSLVLVGLFLGLCFAGNAISGALEDEDNWDRLLTFATGSLSVRPPAGDR